MDPKPDTPFAEVGPDWVLSVRCGCSLIDYIHAYRQRHFAPDLTAAALCARGRCNSCGGRGIEAAWENAHVGPGGLVLELEPRRIRVL